MTSAMQSLSRVHPTADSRLLNNLIKSEKTYIGHLSASVQSAQVAASALSAWGTSESPDVAEASQTLSQLLSEAADVQQTHVSAIEGYRSALKDVADRENSIRSVVRDRDILVGRLIKASKASSKRSAEERAERIAHAQRELTACEEVLASEEAALVGVKRRTFKEALTMRCKTMGDAGAAMVDAAKEAILLLNDFDSSNGASQHTYSHARNDSQASWTESAGAHDDSRHNNAFENSSVTPSQSASQVLRPQAHGVGQYSNHFADIGEAERAGEQQGEEDSDDEEEWRQTYGNATAHQGGGANLSSLPPPHRLHADVGTGANSFLPKASPGVAAAMAGANGSRGSLNGSANGTPPPAPPRKDNKRTNAAPTPSRPQRELNYVPMPPVPTAPRLNSDGTNLIAVPTAPRLYNRDDDSSSDEEAEARRRGGTASRLSVSRGWTPRPSHNNNNDASSDEGATAKASSRPTAKRSGSFFGRVGKLFKTDVKGNETTPAVPAMPKQRQREQWETRTDASLRSGAGVSRRQSLLKPLPGARTGASAAAADDSSSDDEDAGNLVRHVNPSLPLWQGGGKANSDIGLPSKGGKRMSLRRAPSVTAGPLSNSQREKLEEEERMRVARASVIGAGIAGSTPASASTASLAPKKKKTKKVKQPTETGSEVGTSATRARPQSMIVQGSVATGGLGRNDSVRSSNVGGAGTLTRNNSTATSTKSKKKRASVLPGSASGGLTTFSEGKYNTASWVARNPDDQAANTGSLSRSASTRTAAEVAANAGVVAKAPGVATSAGPILAAPTPRHGTKADEKDQPIHVPQPSRTMSPPLKPALKAPSLLGRSGSISPSPASGSRQPIMPPVPSAPPAATTLLQSATTNAATQRAATSTSADGPPRLPEVGAPSATAAGKKPEGSVLSIEQDQRFDGTGSLGFSGTNDSSSTETPAATAASPARPSSVPRPHIDMPISEPFSVDLDAQGKPIERRGSLSPPQETPAFLTPGEAAAYESFFDAAPAAAMSTAQADKLPGTHEGQPTGVTRMTVERKRLMPSRTYSNSGYKPPSETSSSEEGVTAPSAPPVAVASVSTPATAPATSAAAPAAAAASSATLSAPAVPQSDTSHEDGSMVSRRKSVRMAPDVKLPPLTPTPRVEATDPMSRAQASSLALPRIAPPPAAPARLTPARDSEPVDLANPGRERSAWTSRIGARADDSSDDEAVQSGGAELDAYASARRAFSSASRQWGKATGAIKKGAKKEEAPAPAAETEGKKKKKKSKAEVNHGYNAAVPLPAGMQVVGRSPSTKKK